MTRAFSEEFRERAVDLVLTSGLSLRKVAPDLGVRSASVISQDSF
jgi:transposase-like protein